MGLLTPFGMEMEAVGAEIGAASSIKMFRSVMVKGWEALFVEALSAAELASLDAVEVACPEFELCGPPDPWSCRAENSAMARCCCRNPKPEE